MKSSKCFLLGMLVCGVLVAAVGMDRYPTTVTVDPNIYTAPMDANDLAYQIIPLAPKEWTRNFGDNERTRLLYTCNELIKAVMILEKRISALESPKVDPNVPASIVDPNAPSDPNENKQ